MPGKRGPKRKEEVNIVSELTTEKMARMLQIPITQLEREADAGEWDGAFKMKGEVRYFIVHLVMDKQREQAMKSLTIRKVAA